MIKKPWDPSAVSLPPGSAARRFPEVGDFAPSPVLFSAFFRGLAWNAPKKFVLFSHLFGEAGVKLYL